MRGRVHTHITATANHCSKPLALRGRCHPTPTACLTASVRSARATTLSPSCTPGMYLTFSWRSLISSVSFLLGPQVGQRGIESV